MVPRLDSTLLVYDLFFFNSLVQFMVSFLKVNNLPVSGILRAQHSILAH